MSSPWIWNGLFAKSLRSFLNLNNTAYVLQGTANPTTTAQNAPQGSIYMRTGASGGQLYVKQDAGSTTNWTLLSAGGGSVSQLMGSIIWRGGASNTWSRSSSTIGGFSAVAAFTTPSGADLRGSATAPATKIPAITFTSLPIGFYQVVVSGVFQKDTAANMVAWRLHDGTTAGELQGMYTSSGSHRMPVISGTFNYASAQGATTIEVQVGTGDASACSINLSDATGGVYPDLAISVYKFTT